MQRMLLLGVVMLSALATQVQAEVIGNEYKVSIVSTTTSASKNGLVAYSSDATFEYTPDITAPTVIMDGYFIETLDSDNVSSVLMYYTDGTTNLGSGFATSLDFSFGPFGLSVLFGINVFPADTVIFTGYSFALGGIKLN